jgi:deoxyribodipyrimidine photo-lyase
METSIIWLRRDLQVADNASLARALRAGHKVQPVFVFDADILKHFPNKKDRRVSFLANAIFKLSQDFAKRGGSLAVFYGSAKAIIPSFNLPVFAGEDYEPAARERDNYVGSQCNLNLTKQHVLVAPTEALKDDGTPFKVFTPYSKKWLERVKPEPVIINDQGAYANLKLQGTISLQSPQKICEQIGYDYVADDLWSVNNPLERLADFAKNRLAGYAEKRDIPAVQGTSQISPYLRFGLISPQQAYAAGQGSPKWIAELIWREFYAMIMYHYPNTVTEEFQPHYKTLKWARDEKLIEAWKAGQTGYPIVDAGLRELLQTGWMHNRVRMIVASFLTKDLLQDWRVGEAHFAQELMDYDAASNVGGWQWASSVGTDAAPYFRVFNPMLQSEKFDPELRGLDASEIHNPSPLMRPKNYPLPIVDRATVKPKVMAFFKRP